MFSDITTDYEYKSSLLTSALFTGIAMGVNIGLIVLALTLSLNTVILLNLPLMTIVLIEKHRRKNHKIPCDCCGENK